MWYILLHLLLLHWTIQIIFGENYLRTLSFYVYVSVIILALNTNRMTYWSIQVPVPCFLNLR
jgi:hypothetical protein